MTIERGQLMDPRLSGDPLCAGEDPDLFFPNHASDGTQVEHAKRVCYRCGLRELCLDYALAAGEKHGVWGGKSANERRKMRVPRRCLDCPDLVSGKQATYCAPCAEKRAAKRKRDYDARQRAGIHTTSTECAQTDPAVFPGDVPVSTGPVESGLSPCVQERSG